MTRSIQIAIVLFFCLNATGQSKYIKGKITDHKGKNIQDVYVYVDMKIAKNLSKRKGTYRCRVDHDVHLITVYKPEYGFINWTYNGEKNIDFVFPEESHAMSEEDFMALGYGPYVKEEHDKYMYSSFSSVLEILDQTFNQVRVNNGRIIIGRQGPNAFTSDPDPLILVNSIPTSVTSLETIPTIDVKSLRVINKGSETAAYGLRGLNGVILVELKTGDERN